MVTIELIKWQIREFETICSNHFKLENCVMLIEI